MFRPPREGFIKTVLENSYILSFFFFFLFFSVACLEGKVEKLDELASGRVRVRTRTRTVPRSPRKLYFRRAVGGKIQKEKRKQDGGYACRRRGDEGRFE